MTPRMREVIAQPLAYNGEGSQESNTPVSDGPLSLSRRHSEASAVLARIIGASNDMASYASERLPGIVSEAELVNSMADGLAPDQTEEDSPYPLITFQNMVIGALVAELARSQARYSVVSAEAELAKAELEATEANYNFLSFTTSRDAMTGAINRSTFRSHLYSAIIEAVQSSENEVVLIGIVDEDNFKDTNDRLGHPAGDVRIKNSIDEFDQAVRQVHDADDAVARLGGDEYAVLLTGVKNDNKTIQDIFNSLVDKISKTKIEYVHPKTGRVSLIEYGMSLGMISISNSELRRHCTFSDDGVTIPDNLVDQLLVLADEALYATKQKKFAGRVRRGTRRIVEPTEAERDHIAALKPEDDADLLAIG